MKVHSSGREVAVEGKLDCKTEGGFLYLLESEKDPKQYCGQSGARPVDRLSGHIRDISNQAKKAVPKHFQETRSSVKDIIFTPIMKIKSADPYVRLHYERKFISEHNMIQCGININI